MGIPGQIGLSLPYVVDLINPERRSMTWNFCDRSARYAILLICDIIRPILQRIMVAVSFANVRTVRPISPRQKNTLMEGVKTPVNVIWQVLKARTEGMGFNAAARTFEKAKNTILAWESKFLALQQVLFLYALVHEFLEGVIEGDEAYTKVQKNVPQDQ